MAFQRAKFSRFEYVRDENNNVVSVFTALDIFDDAISGNKYIEHRLTGGDLTAFLAAPDKDQALHSLLGQTIRQAHTNWVSENAVKPPPVERLTRAEIAAQFTDITTLPSAAARQALARKP